MSLPALSLTEFFSGIVYLGLAVLFFIYLPVQIRSKVQRLKRNKTMIVCRLCGYRFLRKDQEATCPHCQARNRT